MNNNSVLLQVRQAGIKTKQRGAFQLIRLETPHETLPSELKKTLLTSFCQITDELYDADTSFHWFSKKNYYATISHLWLVFDGTQLLGFTATRLQDACGERIIYIDNMNIKRTSKKIFSHYSVGSMLVNEVLQENARACFGLISVVFRTQNANVYRLGYSILPSGTYPRVDDSQARNTKRSVKINSFMAEQLSPGKHFEADISVIKNAYQGPIYGSHKDNNTIKSRYKNIMSFWNKNVDFDNGDAVLISVCPHRYEFVLALLLYRFNLMRFFIRSRLKSLLRFSHETAIKE